MVQKYHRSSEVPQYASPVFRAPRDLGEIGEITNRWTSKARYMLGSIRLDQKRGEHSGLFFDTSILKRLNRLGGPALHAFLHFMDSKRGRDKVVILTSERVAKTFGVISGWDFKTTEKFVLALVSSGFSDRLTDPSLLKLLDRQMPDVRSAFLFAVEQGNDSVINAIASAPVLRLLRKGALSGWTFRPAYGLFGAIAERNDGKYLADPGFIAALTEAQDAAKNTILSLALRDDIDIRQLVRGATVKVANDMSTNLAPRTTVNATLLKVIRPRSGIKPRIHGIDAHP